MIPASILSTIDEYDIEFEENHVKVDVLDSVELINSRINDRWRPKPQAKEPVVVGLDLHASKNRRGNRSANSLLVLCIDAYCLVVQLKYVDKIPDNLKKFLGDRNTCFVGVDVDRKLSGGVPPPLDPLVCKTAVELSLLAARINKDPSYCNSDLKALAAEYKVSYKPPASGGCCGGRINYDARVFWKDEVKALVHDAYFCYNIAQKLVRRGDEVPVV
ncbi:hypothetical protein Nepgr_029914 [Nepenthes gracilis]|uniref:3'-5' exonuclease domain-containing protein n=1 Tax=Nepenthes gracilis TaxID=150966 RepID=A0AAD3TFV5_NEPGR|nr:hypothetical protein Nepgr_029914 [Nepenthes gracilis]